MKFKIDENLPSEYKAVLTRAGFDAETVDDENLSGRDDNIVIDRCRNENRILMTLDLDLGISKLIHLSFFLGLSSFAHNHKIS